MPDGSQTSAPQMVATSPMYSYGMQGAASTPRLALPGSALSQPCAALGRSRAPHLEGGASGAGVAPAPRTPPLAAAPPQPVAGASTPKRPPNSARAGGGGRQGGPGSGTLQEEISRRLAAEARTRELEATIAQLRRRIATLETDKRRLSAAVSATPSKAPSHVAAAAEDGTPLMTSARPLVAGSRGLGEVTTTVVARPADMTPDDPIDKAICAYLEKNPDFPVSIQKVAPKHYVFGDRGTVYVTERGNHIVVRVGGGFKSLQVFMDERALMVH